MKFIVTQRLCETSEGFDNVGGLYLNIDHISAVFKGDDLGADPCVSPNNRGLCNILMQDGTVFVAAHSISDILDMIRGDF